MENKNGRSCDLCLEREKDIEAETPTLRPPDVKSRLIEKDPDAWED